MSNKHKNASLSSFAAKARMIIKLNPEHMAWVLLLETSPGSGTEGGINPWQGNQGKQDCPPTVPCAREGETAAHKVTESGTHSGLVTSLLHEGIASGNTFPALHRQWEGGSRGTEAGKGLGQQST